MEKVGDIDGQRHTSYRQTLDLYKGAGPRSFVPRVRVRLGLSSPTFSSAFCPSLLDDLSSSFSSFHTGLFLWWGVRLWVCVDSLKPVGSSGGSPTRLLT